MDKPIEEYAIEIRDLLRRGRGTQAIALCDMLIMAIRSRAEVICPSSAQRRVDRAIEIDEASEDVASTLNAAEDIWKYLQDDGTATVIGIYDRIVARRVALQNKREENE